MRTILFLSLWPVGVAQWYCDQSTNHPFLGFCFLSFSSCFFSHELTDLHLIIIIYLCFPSRLLLNAMNFPGHLPQNTFSFSSLSSPVSFSPRYPTHSQTPKKLTAIVFMDEPFLLLLGKLPLIFLFHLMSLPLLLLHSYRESSHRCHAVWP